MTEHVVILAGGKSQLPYVREFQNRGWRVTVVDRDEHAIARDSADTFIANSTYCLDTLIEKLTPENKAHQISTVFSNSSAGPVARNVAELNCVFNSKYSSFSLTSVDRCYSKAKMRECLVNSQVNVADAFTLESLNAEHFPIVIKPSHNGIGGFGVSKIESLASLNTLNLQDKPHEWLYESYIDGDEYSVDGIMVNGELEIISLCRKVSGESRNDFLPNRFELIPLQNMTAYDEIAKQSSLAANALDIDNSQISLDIKIDHQNTVTVIECGIFWDSKIDRLWEHSGFNGYGYFIDRLFRNQDIDNKISLGSAAMEILYSDKEQILNEPEILAQYPNSRIEFEKHSGELIRPPTSVADMIGCRFYQN